MRFLLIITLVLLTAEPFDALVGRFEKSRGREKVEVANAIFARLDEEEVTDSLMVFPVGIHPDSLALQVYYWSGEQKMVENDFKAASAYFTRAAELASRGKDLVMISDCYAELALSLTREGKFDLAVPACEKAIDADTRLGDKDRLVVSLNTMAYICHMSRQETEAEKYITRSLEMARELGDTTKIALRLGTRSDILLAEGRFDEALSSATEAFRLDSLSGNVPKMAIRRVQMAAPLFSKGEYDRAKHLLQQAEPVLAATGNLASLGICENQLGDIACKQERWDDAAKHFGKAVEIYTYTGERLSRSRAHYGMYQALRHSDPAAAALQLERYAYLNDTIYSENVSRMTADFNARYENAELRSRNEMLRQRTWITNLLALLALLVLVLGFVIYYYRTRARLVAQEQRFQLLNERFTHLSKEIEARNETLRDPQMRPVGASKDWLDQVDAILAEQMNHGMVDVNALADRLCISPRQLSRKFNATVGLSSRDYILRYRIDRACKLLAEGEKNVGEVARECGIDDIAYFSRFFRKMTGMTPSEYQKQQLEK